jgi:AmmeMemoRadiSam system protein A
VERGFLLGLARRTLVSAVAGAALPEVAPEGLGMILTEKRACFVTLTDQGMLRGCIGHVIPRDSLYQAVIESAQGAALRDPRFPSVRIDEVDKLRIEISVLTEPRRLEFSSSKELLASLEPNQHGVVLRIGCRTATFLPQVWEQIPDKIRFLERLSEKAGSPSDAWRGKDAVISVYQVEAFEEAEEPSS